MNICDDVIHHNLWQRCIVFSYVFNLNIFPVLIYTMKTERQKRKEVKIVITCIFEHVSDVYVLARIIH
jgi:hypothetical protein